MLKLSKKTRHILTGSVILALLGSCASPYRGPLPDLQLRDKKENEAEIDKFTFEEPSLWTAGHCFYLKGEKYTVGSIEPVIRSVSKEGLEEITLSKRWLTAGLVFAGLSIGSVIASVAIEGSSGKNLFRVGLGFLGLELGALTISNLHLIHSARQFNEDLRRHFFAQKTGLLSPEIMLSLQY